LFVQLCIPRFLAEKQLWVPQIWDPADESSAATVHQKGLKAGSKCAMSGV
jgi:hypothetical protein